VNRQGIEFSFAWLFAIIAGTIILFGAAYIATKLINTEQRVSDTFVSGELDTILDTLGSGISENKFSTISFLEETRVYNQCSLLGPFGRQEISTSSRLGKRDWSKESAYKKSYDIYVFSEEQIDGKKMRAIVAPFYFPFKVGDQTILYAKDYCLVRPTTELESTLEDLGVGNASSIGFVMAASTDDCPSASVRVCFDQAGCDIRVDTGRGIVSHTGGAVHYTDQTLLAAIMSEPTVYDCQLVRLGRRASELAHVYSRKAELLASTGCPNNLALDIRTFASDALFNDSSQFIAASQRANALEEVNDAVSRCKLF
jgi:hypothetical protein